MSDTVNNKYYYLIFCPKWLKYLKNSRGGGGGAAGPSAPWAVCLYSPDPSFRDQFRLGVDESCCPNNFSHCLPENHGVMPKYNMLLFARKWLYLKNSTGEVPRLPTPPRTPYVFPTSALVTFFFQWVLLIFPSHLRVLGSNNVRSII